MQHCVISPRKETEPGVWESVFRFPYNFPGFVGHFPGNPVLPGIVQILAVIHTAGEFTLHKIKNCKFSRSVHPEEDLSVRLQLAPAQISGKYETVAQGELNVNGGVCAVMTLYLNRFAL
jgi:3-hydroxymyristoyl/3-hydroxydecanoyl-(acyl carrier protein) dehydratase